jgi:hypothetical protein
MKAVKAEEVKNKEEARKEKEWEGMKEHAKKEKKQAEVERVAKEKSTTRQRSAHPHPFIADWYCSSSLYSV